nr:hypothetical protein Iba_chr02dCG16940 [Ipomoea batatas]GMD84364.1 hypothetical protein Iba_scaffold360040CG0010 [Ipomoea batatas]
MAGIYNGMELSPARDRPNKRGVDFIIDDHPLSLEIQGAKRFVIAIDFVPVVVPLLGQFPPLKVYFPEENQNQNCEHENGVWGELESVDQQEPHTFCIIQAPFKLVPRVPVRNSDDHRPLAAVGLTGGAGGERGRRSRVVVVGRWRRWGGEGIGDARNGAADCAADGPGTRRELQRGAAAGTVNEHHRFQRKIFEENEVWNTEK